MKKRRIQLVMLFYLFTFSMLSFLIYLYFFGMAVTYHRNTGPDFTIRESVFFSKSSIQHAGRSYRDFFPIKSYDSDNGFLDPTPIYVVVGKVKGLQSVSGNEAFPKVNIALFFRIEWMYALIVLLTITVFLRVTYSLYRL